MDFTKMDFNISFDTTTSFYLAAFLGLFIVIGITIGFGVAKLLS